MTAIRATYADWKLIKTRARVQIVFEVPVEQADDAYQLLGGMPVAANEVWCGIARLDKSKAADQPRPDQSVGVPAGAKYIPTSEGPRKFETLPYATQAGIRCNDAVYRAFLREMCAQSAFQPDEAATAIRELCEVESRADIRPGTDAEKKWRELEGWFAAWQTKERAMA